MREAIAEDVSVHELDDDHFRPLDAGHLEIARKRRVYGNPNPSLRLKVEGFHVVRLGDCALK